MKMSIPTQLDLPLIVDEEMIAGFRSRGHVRIKAVASEFISLIRPLVTEIVRAQQSKNDTQGRVEEYTSMFTQVTNIWKLSAEMARFVLAKRFAHAAAALMGVPGVRLYHDQALFKPAGGKRTPWHQDQFYWPVDTTNTITMWMPLVDISPTMGTMLFADGSHTNGPLLKEGISDHADATLAQVIEKAKYPITEYGDFKAGDATFHSGWTVHSAYPNKSDTVREVLTVIYFADGARITSPETEFQEADIKAFFPGLNPGDLAASQLNPLLR
ncbi:MAG TPA: phytanoyl-CoA dioxygenase family protein [Bacteroidota bacterium]|jgi:ectoine hydroxylase-related dioxygenase (phytanoyl-CoA dioxygenase family)